MKFGPPSPPRKYTKNIFKYIQDISKISKINKKYQVAAGPAPGLVPVLGRAGPATARCLVFILDILDIFGFQGCVSLERLSPLQSYCTEPLNEVTAIQFYFM